ncbi:MAG: Chromosome partition protein smc [uncultured Thermomicrobiales bacterium]|uniref:Chromosome partition protein Smc n=1 Tax=uncultured Thermomicrobiales bacterium TaxID=1645740 RepID=A0A6J4U0S9_9BACT|nr:MAG: Chromosome partition protein smc [uncultured Thermomicrobiales bacterium]
MTDVLLESAPPAVAPTTRLLRLELHGFKSFASRTVVRFEPGITAIVGPNGSGKSNVADAVRWVLGEQGAGALRARKTEEVIFAGGQGRAPAGMAEATLVFDNGDGWLPVGFAEVAVTRRAFRGGENHYLINGKRVRLKDVALLTAGLGQGHLVVGQGLVDTALSQKPEERRALFEHAADLAGLRLRVAEAERNLAEADANSQRVGDLLADLEPRLKGLERAARQAREWHGLRADLRALQRTHLAALLRLAVTAKTSAAAADDAAASEVATAQADSTRLAAEVEAARSAAAVARDARSRLDLRRRDLDETLRRTRHERDLAGERVAALNRRLADMADTQAGLDEQAAAVAADLDRLASDLAALDAESAAESARSAALAAAVAAARAERCRVEQAAAADSHRHQDGERELAALAGKRALVLQRHEAATLERERLRAAGDERGNRIAALRAELAAADAAREQEAATIAALDARLAALGSDETGATSALAAATRAVADAERALNEATTRLGVLRRLHEQGAGLYAGVRETLAAARAGRLSGVVGAVAELVESPPELETAVEVALGGHLQDLVVGRWGDAEAAIAHLKRTGAGRATFQPLDTVTANRRPPPERALGLPGVHGVAADLVGHRSELRPVVDALLGRTLVVADLPTARTALPLLPPGWSTVTLGGEVARAGGSVTGGAAVRESGVLGRERELRDLPETIAALERTVAGARSKRDEVDARLRRHAAERRGAEAERAASGAAGEERLRQQTRLAAWLADLERDEATAAARLATLAGEAESAWREAAAIEAAAQTLERTLADLDAGSRERRMEEDRAADALAAAEREAAATGQRRAGLDERLRAERRREQGLRTREAALAEETTLRQGRAAGLEREREALAAAVDRLAVEATALERDPAALEAERTPLEAGVAAAEADLFRLGRALDEARATVLDRERAHGLAALAAERAAGEVAALARRIGDELDLADPFELLTRDEPSSPVPPPAARVLGAKQQGGSDVMPATPSVASWGGEAATAAPFSPPPRSGSPEAVGLVEGAAGPVDRFPNDPSPCPATLENGAQPGQWPDPEHRIPSAEAREREIARLKEKLRRIGYVGEEAVADYEREAARTAFLRSQLADIHGAAAALRELLADLDETMRARFEATVGRVADEFSALFAALFGGGTARLELARGADGEPGVEIVAQPPGKRLQTLALLSGGERALTAVALLFAILRVNPAPFCLLDEVDAALDEANVVRFRDQLRLLAARTQTVVVTHNRGTIETADTLYGVSMGADGVSKTLSLRLSEATAEA